MKRITAALLAIAFTLTTMQTAFGKEARGAQITDDQAYQCNTDPAVIEQIRSSRTNTKEVFSTGDLVRTKSGFLDQWSYSNYMPSTGDVRALVLTIEFADVKLNDSENEIQAYNSLESKLFAPYNPSKKLSEQSVRGYLYQSSYGRLDVTGDIMPLYTARKTYNTCATDGYEWSSCIKEAVDFYISDPTIKLDLSNYDSNQDGIVDCLYVFSCSKTSYDAGEKMLGAERRAIDYNNGEFKIEDFVMVPIKAPVDVCVHETGHLWGLQDNYKATSWHCYLDSGLNDIMGSGYYFNAYYKWLLGWIEPKILTNENSPEETVELSPVESFEESAEGCYKAVVLVPDPSLLPFTEFFIAEYRIGGTGYDPPSWYENGVRVEFPETPGIILWHCDTDLSISGQYRNKTGYLLPVYKSGRSRDPNKQYNNIYQARDLYGINEVFSSTSTVNSNFYNNFYTGAYLKVEDMVTEKATLQAGFRDPDLTPGPVIHLSEPSPKATKDTIVTYTATITAGTGGEIIPFEELTIDYYRIRDSRTGNLSANYLDWFTQTNPMTITFGEGCMPSRWGNGTVQLILDNEFITYNGRKSPKVTGEPFYVDSIPPEIVLTGDNPQRIVINTDYTELGAQITDNLDPNIESKLEIDTSKVDTSTAGTYTVTYNATDHAGNTATKTRTVVVEMPPPITAEIEYSPSTATNGNVTATLKLSEEVTVTNNGGSSTYTFSDNGSFTFEFKNAVGNTGNATATVDWIDKTPPTATVSYATTDPTNQDVTATITPSEEVTITSEGGTSHTFTENGSFTFAFKDKAGNAGTVTAKVDWIDKMPPTATVEYSTTDPTNESVLARLIPSEDITITNNDGNQDYTFTDNGEFAFTFRDKAGNTGTATAVVDWIDKTPPTATVEYSPSTATNGDVTATLKPSEEVTVTNNDGSLTHTFSENDTFTFEFKDAAGNTGNATATVDWIDKTPPTAAVEYSPSTATSGDVTATLKPSEAVTVTNNGGSLTHTFSENDTFTFEFKDAAGNTGNATATVDWIDKTPPTAAVEYSPSTATSGDVTATLKPSEAVTVTNNGGSLTHTFSENDTFTFEFKDAAGNTGNATATVDWIDKIPPTATVNYSIADWTNKDVTAVIVPSERVTMVSSGGESHTFTANGSFTFEFKDMAGNQGSVTATVDNIDKTPPVIALKGDNPQTIEQDKSYTELGASVTDDLDTGIDKKLKTDASQVDTSKAGEYVVVYTATDHAGNITEAKRKVVVKAKTSDPAPPAPGPAPGPDPTPTPTPTPSWENPFIDVAKHDWYYSAVRYASENGLFYGTSNTTFSPHDDMTRGMLATVIYRLAKEPETTVENLFNDVADGKYYTEAIAWAAENKIVAGYGNNRFGPEDSITREQLATILWHYAGSPESVGNLDKFTDGEKASTWAVSAMQWAVEQKIVSGKGNGILDPRGKATRSEVAAMLLRFCNQRG